MTDTSTTLRLTAVKQLEDHDIVVTSASILDYFEMLLNRSLDEAIATDEARDLRQAIRWEIIRCRAWVRMDAEPKAAELLKAVQS